MKKKKAPIATYHFRTQLSYRFKIADCSFDAQEQIKLRIENGLFLRYKKCKNGTYKYDLFTEGLLKSMMPTVPDMIRVVYDCRTKKLITIMPCD